METVYKVVRWKLSFLSKWWPILTLMWCIFWFIFIFTPVIQGDAVLRQISHNTFSYTNVSRKPFPSELICDIQSSVTIIETNLGTDYKKNHPTDRWGTGNRDWKTWRVRGPIPVGAEVLEVHKELTYKCFNFLNKKVRTAKRIIDVDQ